MDDVESRAENDLPTPLGFRIVRSLMLLAAAVVLLFGLPFFAWQLGTTLAREQFDVDGRTYVVSITRRGAVAVWIQQGGGTDRYVVETPDGEPPTGPGRIGVAADHRSFVARVGEVEVTFDLADGLFVRRE